MKCILIHHLSHNSVRYSIAHVQCDEQKPRELPGEEAGNLKNGDVYVLFQGDEILVYKVPPPNM